MSLSFEINEWMTAYYAVPLVKSDDKTLQEKIK